MISVHHYQNCSEEVRKNSNARERDIERIQNTPRNSSRESRLAQCPPEAIEQEHMFIEIHNTQNESIKSSPYSPPLQDRPQPKW